MSLTETLAGRTIAQAREALADRPFRILPYASPKPDPLVDEERIVRARELPDGSVELIACAFRTRVDG